MSNIGAIGGPGATPGFEQPEAASSEAGPAPGTVRLGSEQLDRYAAVLGEIAAGQATLGFNPSERSEAVEAVQRLLASLGYDPQGVDGRFGRGTERAVAAFQRAQGLTPTGVVDAETLARLDEALQLGAVRPRGPAREELLFVGMGQYARHEAKDLERRGVRVRGVFDTAVDDQVTLSAGGRRQTFDLTTPEGIRGYVAALGVSGDKAAELERILEATGRDARDEVAQVMQALVEAERGNVRLERMVLSGHSVGSGVWGDNNGFFGLETLESLLKAFPRAAAQVEDFMIAGCYSSSEQHVQRFRAMFPNLKTFWAYGDSAPGTWSGAMIHNRIWERATRGHDYGAVERRLAAGTRKGENVATWNIEDGYQAAGPSRPLAEVRAELEGMQATYDACFRGEQTVQDTQRGPLRDYYRRVQELLGNPALPAGERPALERLRDQTIRLIFFDHPVKVRFQETFGAQIEAGYRALGLQPPDFSQLSRAEALAAIERFERALTQRVPPPREAAELLPILVDGLRDLRPSVIPNTWV
ncbi:MAG: hypothetical protein KatS3mg102_2116 [Planctomycetota bacterium]|nr:MAG: hypothetical protein KatS3mg102_2116 [Planctomycetota bacterium]